MCDKRPAAANAGRYNSYCAGCWLADRALLLASFWRVLMDGLLAAGPSKCRRLILGQRIPYALYDPLPVLSSSNSQAKDKLRIVELNF